MVKKELFKKINMNNEFDNTNDELETKGKMLFDIFIGSIPVFIDTLIKHFEKIKIKDDELCDVSIDFNEYINIIEPKINIIQFYFKKLDYNDFNIIVESNYPQTKVKFIKVDNQFINYLKDVKFLIFCEYHKNIGHA